MAAAPFIDDIALRKEWDAWSIVGTGNPLRTWYHLTDTLFSTIAVIDEAANLIERVSYDAYGNAQHHRIGDINGDGSTNFKDRDLIIEWMGGITTGLGDYGVGDLNRDGVVNYTDASICFADYGAALPIGQPSTICRSPRTTSILCTRRCKKWCSNVLHWIVAS